MTKTARIARDNLMKNLIELNKIDWIESNLRDDIPEAWHTLESDLDVEEPKQKVTLYLDRSVAKFYRAMGRGYQSRINRLLATWAQMKIAEEVSVDRYLEQRLKEKNEKDEDPQANKSNTHDSEVSDPGSGILP